jgi:imidazolonepropionase-like amidohydrolase
MSSHFTAKPLLALTSALAIALSLTGCATTSGKPASEAPAQAANAPAPKGLDSGASDAPFASTYAPLPRTDFVIINAHGYDGIGHELTKATVVVKDGKIASVTEGGEAPAGLKVIDAAGKYVTPGIIDAHSHLGVYATPGNFASSDGNEATKPNTAEVWAEHSVWPQDPGFNAARRGGVTTLLILPGSANLFGGRSVTLKNVPSVTTQGMKFPGAPYGLKMACGENPKRVYGKKSGPQTRMGNVAGYRAAWIAAAAYERDWKDYREKLAKSDKAQAGTPAASKPTMPKRDLQLETLAGVLRGEIMVENHCYRADEMATMIDIAHEFGFKITAFHHSIESYKIAPLLAKEDICSATWAGWWGFKMESLDGIEENAALLQKAGACAVIHSDDAILTQRLNQEAAAALSAGWRAGINISKAEAFMWVTHNPAKMMGIADKTGSLEAGKGADIVLWDADPFSIYARTQQVYIDGALVYDRNDPAYQPVSDFELGFRAGKGL